MAYTQISKEDVVCISKMVRAGCSYSEIARVLGKSVSSISRHVREYGSRENYDVREVRRKKKMIRIGAMKSIRVVKGTMLTTIKRLLVSHYSPEQISGYLKKKKVSVAASTIYRYINERVPYLKIHLRSQKGKYRRRRGTLQRMEENALKYKRRIDERPKVVECRGRHGDFEGDTMLGSDKRVRIVTYVDRRTGYLIAFLLPKFSTQLLSSLTIKHFSKVPRSKKKTITLDNGIEFADWPHIEEKTKMIIYFAYPYHSWERGTNENTNGLLRQYFPKKYDFNLITKRELQYAVRKLNGRPRKRLKFSTPRKEFCG